VGDEQLEYGTSVEHFDKEEAARKGRYDMIGYGKMHILEERASQHLRVRSEEHQLCQHFGHQLLMC
jgi:hypothetical protein